MSLGHGLQSYMTKELFRFPEAVAAALPLADHLPRLIVAHGSPLLWEARGQRARRRGLLAKRSSLLPSALNGVLGEGPAGLAGD